MSGATVFLVILILILLALAITFLVLWLIKREKKENNPGDLVINNLVVRLTDQSTATATWSNTGSGSNQVFMFADTQKINIDPSGKPSQASGNLLSSGPVSENLRTISIQNLKPQTKYFIEVVVTGDGRSNSNPATLFTGGVPTTEFSIEELNASGGIELGSDRTTVTYQSKLLNKNLDDLWTYNTQNFRLTSRRTGGATGAVLYNNNGTLAAAASNSSVLTNANSQWTYNSNGQNKWCLQGSNTVCLKVTDLSADNSPIQVISGGDSQWKNKTTPL